ncbi:extracellular catalytic domain type 1 short-chain-length polyhydroxyalkanoate depolymerase [Pseudaminobacter sp. NGMCC 1.201702]|uniref:extracellular catalytic domain type 1 short-chain-length polyhydroxyalkanoate depolymerase n=1 Tax=Pseudaminobacter sp. NGMCC 1.201702 TaxID=3391825 RepID=UPI0039EE9148
MRKLSDTIARLGALKAQNASYTAGNDCPPENLATLLGFGSNPGVLQAKYYIPKHLPQGAPLVVVLHGCTQTAAGYNHHSGWSELAEEEGFALLFPEQQRTNNPNLCFNWFQPGDARRGSGEVLSIRQMIDAMVLIHRLDRNRVFVTGLSAGGAMAAALLASYPEVFAGGAIIAGLPFGSATTISQAFDRMRGHGGPSHVVLQRALRGASDHQGPWPRISIWHGSADKTVVPSNAESMVGQWRGVHKLDERPTYSKTTGVIAKQVWCDPSGDAVIEINMIAGIGHGTPIGDGLGVAGPYMLDVGISSTREIARFWRIAQSDGKATYVRSASTAGKRPPPKPSDGSAVHRRHPASKGSGVQQLIEDALRAAGLMR